MHVDTDADVLRLRAGLRDLVALSAIPAVWIGSEPLAVAAGLADALVGLLALDFAFVRLCDPGGAGAVDVTRGNAWTSFPQWLEGHLATSASFPRKEVVCLLDDDSPRRRGLVVPVGVNGEGGVVAASSGRSDFPTSMDRLLLSLAANHAATAFRSARLVHARRRAEEELRNARDELEVNVAERTAELRRSEAYLAEAQTLTDTGSFAIDVCTGEVAHSSDQHSRLFGFDPGQGTPPLADFLQRVHPQDRTRFAAALEKGIREARNVDLEYRIVLPQGSVKRLRVIAHPGRDASDGPGEFVGTVMDVTERRQAEAQLERLVREQAALRRVATLVARGAASEEVFAAVVEEVVRVLPVDIGHMGRYDSDGTLSFLAASGETDVVLPVGTRLTLGGKNVSTLVFETGRPARVDYADASGPLALAARERGIRSSVGTPIIVEGRPWGLMVVGSSRDAGLLDDIEARLASFTDLVATAIANAESRAGLARLAEEQAALRRVATLVARAVPPEEVFAAVTQEVGRLLGTDLAGMARYDRDDTVTVVATWAAEGELARAHPLVPGPWPLDGGDVASMVSTTGRSVRIDDYAGLPGRIAEFVREELGVHSSVASPIVVEGRLWGALFLHSKQTQPLPRDTESRLTGFTELVATGIADTQARAEIRRLAEEQAALRRVATLVAREASPAEVFAAVTEELGRLLGADIATLVRLEPGDTAVVVAHWSKTEDGRVPVGACIPLEGGSVAMSVLRTGRPARAGSAENASPQIAALAHRLGVTSTVAAPIVVEGHLWGGVSVSSQQPEPLPPDTESRMTNFAELVATAIANAEARTELAVSRARVVAAADETRRRLERNLHDGAQQRLVSLVLELRGAEATLGSEGGNLGRQLSRIGEGLNGVLEDLRKISHGLHPAILSEAGLKPALKALARRSAVPVQLDMRVEARLPESIEVAAYYVVSEGLANAVKHANASVAEVDIGASDGNLRLSIRDDGQGGADPAGGSGLIGLKDRVEAQGGTIAVVSPPGEGTRVQVSLPIGSADEQVDSRTRSSGRRPVSSRP
jgi:GAF domain-containing protein